jgi:hypothetical protein
MLNRPNAKKCDFLFLAALTELATISHQMSPQCMQHSLPVLCYSAFPPCSLSSSAAEATDIDLDVAGGNRATGARGGVRRICRDACERLERTLCRDEFALLRRTTTRAG